MKKFKQVPEKAVSDTFSLDMVFAYVNKIKTKSLERKKIEVK